jgi:hypothetical protein
MEDTKGFRKRKGSILAMTLLVTALAASSTTEIYAEQPPSPCHPNPTAAADEAALRARATSLRCQVH